MLKYTLWSLIAVIVWALYTGTLQGWQWIVAGMVLMPVLLITLRLAAIVACVYALFAPEKAPEPRYGRSNEYTPDLKE